MKSLFVLVALSCLAAANGGRWDLIWADEFDGNQLNQTNWEVEVDCSGMGNGEAQCYTARTANVQVTGGNLVLKAKSERYTGTQQGCTGSSGCTDTKDFTSGKIRSRTAAFDQGRIEFRAQLPKGDYLWPALWMLPMDWAYGGWAASGEIDIMEARGQDRTHIASTLHYNAPWPNDRYTSSGDKSIKVRGNDVDLTDDFHIYALEWEKNNVMRFYIDTTQIWSTNLNKWWKETGDSPYTATGQPWDQSFRILINLAVGGAFFGNLPPVTTDDASSWEDPNFKVDYVRVYAPAGNNADNNNNNNNDNNAGSSGHHGNSGNSGNSKMQADEAADMGGDGHAARQVEENQTALSDNPSASSAPRKESSKGVNVAGVSLIVVGCVAAAAGVAMMVVAVVRMRRRRPIAVQEVELPGGELSFGNLSEGTAWEPAWRDP